HCAALIDVDYCEKNKVKCYDTNVHGTKNIAIACDLRDIYLLYISSSMVFDGDSGIAYTENMEANPINMYSLSKYLGERYIIDGNEGLIVRTNIIGESKGFFKWIYDSVKKGEKIKLYKDLYFNTIYINTFADCLKKLIDKREKGLYHIASKDYMSKYEFGKLVESVFGLQGNIVSISYNSVIPRPKKAVLNCSKYEKEFGKLPTIKETLKKIKESM
ncbi:MAG: SDR family oxidoreductase, partial [Candidatus Pacearchaeota archaeon]